jgi:hypothetical protein
VKLYVWEGVLRDYTDGMAVALAPDLDTAVTTVLDSMGYTGDLREVAEQEFRSVVPVVTEVNRKTRPQAWYVYGGG